MYRSAVCDFVIKIIVQSSGVDHGLVAGFAGDVDAFMSDTVVDPASGCGCDERKYRNDWSDQMISGQNRES